MLYRQDQWDNKLQTVTVPFRWERSEVAINWYCSAESIIRNITAQSGFQIS